MQAITDNFFVTGQINAEHFTLAKAQGITLIINNRPDGEENGILSVADAQQLAAQQGITYLHLPMANGQPLPEDLIPSMQTALQEQTKDNGKTLAHCRSGTRSSFLWAAVQIIEGQASAQETIQMAAQAGINLTSFMPFLQHLEQ